MCVFKQRPLINTVSAQQFLLSGNAVSSPVLAFKAKSPDRVASMYNTVATGTTVLAAHSLGQGLIGAASWGIGVLPFLLGANRDLNKKVIDSNDKVVQEGLRSYKKLVWDPIHKMMVRG